MMENWNEEHSATYRALAEIAVPSREEQLATLLCLLPFGKSDVFRMVDLGCGEGVLEYAALTAFPRASTLALDGSASMREHARSLLTRFSSRVDVRNFALDSEEWFALAEGADCVASSLVVHHLTNEGKRRMFGEVYRRLNMGGALLLIDVVLPRRVEGVRMQADAYDRVALRQSISRTGNRALFDKVAEDMWNVYRYPEPTEMLAPLSDQLAWLSEVGFEGVDCFWLQAGHAVFGGYKPGGCAANESDALSLDDAHEAVRRALDANAKLTE